MPRPRLPQDKAQTIGAATVNPARFIERKKPPKTRPLGEPYAAMTDPQKAAWEELKGDIPWLNSSHRTLLRATCMLVARMDDDSMGVQALQALSSMLSKLGATPVDETRVTVREVEDEDPADRFFERSH